MSGWAVVNGRLLPLAEAAVSVLDLGFLRGLGAFETLRTYEGHPHALGEHLCRLWQAAAWFGIGPCFSEADARRWIAALHARGDGGDLRLNIVVTPGPHGEGVFGTAGPPTWALIARPLHAPPESAYREGVAVITRPGGRLLPELKTTCYLGGYRPLSEARAAGAHEALYVDASGAVTEGVTSNVLIRRGQEVITPAEGCLCGITRAGLRPIVESHGLVWREGRLAREDLYGADEVWLASAVRELLPVVRVDGRPIADGRVGPWAGPLRAAYRAHCIASARAEAARAAI